MSKQRVKELEAELVYQNKLNTSIKAALLKEIQTLHLTIEKLEKEHTDGN